MPVYRVELVRKDTYEVIIRADSQEEAKDLAYEFTGSPIDSAHDTSVIDVLDDDTECDND